ncbi:MAG: type I restriction-modification enzyme R subunit C-terminal domain-containing protein [Opitutaceae bacterium]
MIPLYCWRLWCARLQRSASADLLSFARQGGLVLRDRGHFTLPAITPDSMPDAGSTAVEPLASWRNAAARAPLTGAIVTQIVEACTANMQTIDHDTQDKLLRAEWDADAQTRAAAFADDFETFCREHRDQLDALTILLHPALIRDHVITSLRMEKEDLDYAPFDARGGLGRMRELFGERMDALMEEMNEGLTA